MTDTCIICGALATNDGSHRFPYDCIQYSKQLFS